MKKIILLLMAFMVQGLMAQSDAISVPKADTFIPQTLFAGTRMSTRTVSSSYDDTTRGFVTRNYSTVYVGLETAVNDSTRLLLSYQPSANGVTYDALVLFDSLSTTGTVGKMQYFALPAGAMGAYSVRVRVYANTDLLRYSSSASTTLTTRIIRKQQ